MRVLYLNAPTALAGAERVILNYVANCNASRFDVHVASLLNFQRLENPFTAAVEGMGKGLEKIPIGNTDFGWQIRKVVSIIKRHGIETLHTHGYRADITGLFASRICGIPIVSTVHGWTPVSYKLHLYEMMDRLFLRWFHRVICVSKPLHDELEKLGTAVYVPNAVSIPQFSDRARWEARQRLGISQSSYAILSVGRLSKEKGLVVLLDALSRLGSTGEPRLIVVGDGPLRQELQALALKFGVNVCFTGFVSDVSSYYAAADLFVMSSHTEGSPMALLEAMSWGLPSVSTRVGGIPFIIEDGVNGCLVPPADSEALTSAIRKEILGSGRSSKIGRNARQTIMEKYSVQRWVSQLESIYESLPCRK